MMIFSHIVNDVASRKYFRFVSLTNFAMSSELLLIFNYPKT